MAQTDTNFQNAVLSFSFNFWISLAMSLLFPSFRSRIWISLSVGEEDEDEEDDEE